MRGIFGALSPDLIAPTVSILTPANGSTISGTINLTATASDDHGVVGVQWKVNGVNLGAEQTVSPYTQALDTTTHTDGSYTISATARDAVGHTTTQTIPVTISNIPAGGSFGTFDPTPGGRRTYDFSNGSFASPNYIDSPGWSWGGNPHAGTYVLQMRYVASDLESINGPQSDQNHAYALGINGVEIFVMHNNPTTGNTDSGWFDVPDGAAGTITFHDWADGSGAGGSAFVGNVTLTFQYREP